ncbi:MAG: alpha/beta fold hydrolase [Chloroflexota bacterium]
MKHYRLPGPLGLLIVLLALVIPASAQTNLEPAACPFPLPPGEVEGQTITCGYFTVPQDRAEPAGPTVRLAYAVLSATGPALPDPIVYLEGGPGGSALTGLDLWVNSALRVTRDIVLFDQRGAGYSQPRLICTEYNTLSEDASDEDFIAAMTACRDRFISMGVDLSDFNSANSAQDTADLATALGYNTYNLYGISYGTRLALTVMRDRPAGLRSVVLDSTYPPLVDAYEEQSRNSYRALEQLFNDCAADPACASAYPDLRARFYALVDRLNFEPATDPEEFPVFGDDIIGLMVEALYNTPLLPYLPLLIDELDRGVFDTYLGILNGEIPPYSEIAAMGDSFSMNNDPVIAFVDQLYFLTELWSDEDFFMLFDDIVAWGGSRTGLEALITDYFVTEEASDLLGLLDTVPEADLLRIADEFFVEDEDIFTTLEDLETAEDIVDYSDTDGMFNSVECYEELPFNSFEDAEAIAAELPAAIADLELFNLEMQLITCDIWLDSAAPEVETLPVSSDVPVLVLAGNYDPVTPPAWGELAAQSLPNSLFLSFPGIGHAVIDGGDCPRQIVTAFINAPNVAPDTRCMSTLRVDFVLP